MNPVHNSATSKRASEGSEALPSLARRVRMSFFGARVIEGSALLEEAGGVQRGHSYYWSQDKCSGQFPMITFRCIIRCLHRKWA